MIFPTPRLVVIDLGRPSFGHEGEAAERLCIDELVSIVNELADLGIAETRLVLHDLDAIDDLARLIEYARRRRCSVTAVWRAPGDGAEIADIARAKPDAIAIPLDTTVAAIRMRRADRNVLEWSRSVLLAEAVRVTGAPLEIETQILPGHSVPILCLSEVVESLRPASWRIDFSHARLTEPAAAAVAAAIAEVAEQGHVHLSVHELPPLGRLVRQRMAALRPADSALLVMSGAAESMHITWCGDVQTDSSLLAGNIRHQTLEAIYELSPAYVAMRRAAPRSVEARTPRRPAEARPV